MFVLHSLFFAASVHLSLADFILDVGAPRSGTQSMFEALKMLGLNTLWSGYYTNLRSPWCTYLFKTHKDPPFDALRGFDGAMDEPFHLIYEEFLQARPDAKFIYTVSDPDSWYDSYKEFFDMMHFSMHSPPNPAPIIKEPYNRMSHLQLGSQAPQDLLYRGYIGVMKIKWKLLYDIGII